MNHQCAIIAAETFVRELRFHQEAPRPERMTETILRLRLELDRIEREVTSGRSRT